MTQDSREPKDRRMKAVRKKLRDISARISELRRYMENDVPESQRPDFEKQLQRAFDAGRAFAEIQHVPHTIPVDDEGLVQIGPALRRHVLEARKVYEEINDLTELVSDIFNQASENMLRAIIRNQQETASRTDAVEFSIEE